MTIKEISALALTAIALLCGIEFSAGQGVADGLFEKYRGQKDVTFIEVNRGLFEILAEVDEEDPDFKMVQDAVSGLDKMKVLALETEGENPGSELLNDLVKDVEAISVGPGFEELMTVTDPDASIRFYIRRNGKMVQELLMLVTGSSVVVMNLTGNIDINQIARLASAVDLEGMEYLKKIER